MSSNNSWVNTSQKRRRSYQVKRANSSQNLLICLLERQFRGRWSSVRWRRVMNSMWIIWRRYCHNCCWISDIATVVDGFLILPQFSDIATFVAGFLILPQFSDIATFVAGFLILPTVVSAGFLGIVGTLDNKGPVIILIVYYTWNESCKLFCEEVFLLSQLSSHFILMRLIKFWQAEVWYNAVIILHFHSVLWELSPSVVGRKGSCIFVFHFSHARRSSTSHMDYVGYVLLSINCKNSSNYEHIWHLNTELAHSWTILFSTSTTC